MKMMPKLLVANWKSNPHNVASAIKLAKFLDKKGIVIAPPYPFLEQVGKAVKYAELGAQDIFWEDVGPYTGEVSWRHLNNLKVKYVIIGHSERRKYLNETDELISKKVSAAIKNGLKVVLCIGEPAFIRKRGIKKAKEFVKKQLIRDLQGLHTTYNMLHTNLIIAYEPVWAISTEKGSKPDRPEDTVEMIAFIKKLLHTTYHIPKPKVLYGGSVTAKNAKDFLQEDTIDGALVGAASLKAKEAKKIINIAKDF